MKTGAGIEFDNIPPFFTQTFNELMSQRKKTVVFVLIVVSTQSPTSNIGKLLTILNNIKGTLSRVEHLHFQFCTFKEKRFQGERAALTAFLRKTLKYFVLNSLSLSQSVTLDPKSIRH